MVWLLLLESAGRFSEIYQRTKLVLCKLRLKRGLSLSKSGPRQARPSLLHNNFGYKALSCEPSAPRSSREQRNVYSRASPAPGASPSPSAAATGSSCCGCATTASASIRKATFRAIWGFIQCASAWKGPAALSTSRARPAWEPSSRRAFPAHLAERVRPSIALT